MFCYTILRIAFVNILCTYLIFCNCNVHMCTQVQILFAWLQGDDIKHREKMCTNKNAVHFNTAIKKQITFTSIHENISHVIFYPRQEKVYHPNADVRYWRGRTTRQVVHEVEGGRAQSVCVCVCTGHQFLAELTEGVPVRGKVVRFCHPVVCLFTVVSAHFDHVRTLRPNP